MAFNGLGNYSLAANKPNKPPNAVVVGVALNGGQDQGAQYVSGNPTGNEVSGVFGVVEMSGQTKNNEFIDFNAFSPPLPEGPPVTVYFATITNVSPLGITPDFNLNIEGGGFS